MEKQLVAGDGFVTARLPDDTQFVSPGVSLPLSAADDLDDVVGRALTEPIDRPPLREQVKRGDRVTVAFDDATVPCYAPVWAAGIPAIVRELEVGGVRRSDISLVCANALHRQFTHEELTKLIGEEIVREFSDGLSCNDAEDPEQMVHLGTTERGHDVVVNRCVTDSDLTVYLNCSTTRGFSGGWKSVCVGLSDYRSIHHHHDPDTMSMSLHRNEMHEILDEMGAVVERTLGVDRIFKLETVLANPLAVHAIYSGSVGVARSAALGTLRAHQPARRDLLEEPVDVVVYGVPDWSPYAAFSHGNPILDLISTGLGYLGGMIQALGKPGCTVVMANPARDRWDTVHHASYPFVWNEVLPVTRDPEEARARFEPLLAQDRDLIDKYRFANAFHPVHSVMAIYPLKRLRHADRVIVAGAEDPGIPQHCGFESAPTVEAALDAARDSHGPGMLVALVEYPPAINRQ